METDKTLTLNHPQLETILRGIEEIIALPELLAKLKKNKPLRVKLGVDPTAPDLHLGHTVVLNKLKTFQNLGHTIVFIIGDLTAQIGDPSGQSVTRPRLDPEKIRANAETYQKQVFKILDPTKTEIRFNSEWLETLGVKGLLSLGFHYTVQRILERDDFSKRIKEGRPVAFSECFYPLLQGYDSVAVNADIELGGTDQKFNLLVARELQRDFNQEAQVVITLPLLVGTDGTKKMSKSYGNTIALNDAPQEIFGKIMSISDDLMLRYYELLTMENLAQIKTMHPKEAKMQLAKILIAQYYGSEEATAAQEHFTRVFSHRDAPETIETFMVTVGKKWISHLVFESGLAESKKEAKRLIEGGGIKIDQKTVQQDQEIDLKEPFLLQAGKRKFKKIAPTAS